MAPSRASIYIPSTALIRALSRPLLLPSCRPHYPLRARFLSPTCVQGRRGKRSKAGADGGKDDAHADTASLLSFFQNKAPPKDAATATSLRELGVPEISLWEQDLDTGAPERLIRRISTPADVAREKKKYAMLKEDASNPNYDDTELRHMLLDDMMVDPNFSDLRDSLEEIKAGMMTPEEMAKMKPIWEREMKTELRQFNAQMLMASHESMQEMIDDPEFANVRSDLLDVQAKLPQLAREGDHSDVNGALERLRHKLQDHPAYERIMAENKEKEAEMASLGLENPDDDSDLDLLDARSPFTLDDNGEPMPDLDVLVEKMGDLLKSMGGDPALASELEELRNMDPYGVAEDEAEDQELDADAVADQLSKLKGMPSSPESNDDQIADPELEAKVNKIMEDPNLLQKLALIKEYIALKKANLAIAEQPSAPDPLTLDKSRLATYGDRLKQAENDPEHIAALRRLRVNLLPPFNVSPALKSLNDALKLAYLGASDDVRRVLWRTYTKARTLPTLLQNMPDDAWDMIWYSQAVNWRSNQNRENHLKLLLHDLESVGKDGPPTHPDRLKEQPA